MPDLRNLIPYRLAARVRFAIMAFRVIAAAAASLQRLALGRRNPAQPDRQRDSEQGS